MIHHFTAKMPTTIDQLDDLSLLRIFDELSIDDLFCAGSVCFWWNGIRSKSANGRKELNLLVGRNSHICERYIQDSAFRIPEKVKKHENEDASISSSEKNLLQSDAPFKVQFPSSGIVQFLYDNLPNLTTLTMSCHIEDNQIGFVISLLKLYASTGQLQTLKLLTNSMNQPLLNTLNSIKSLKKLQLNLQFGNSAVKIDLPILGQLEEFDFFKGWLDNFSLDGLRNSLQLYGVQNPKLKNIRIDCPVGDFNWMLSLPRQFASRFTHLHIDLNEPFVNRGLAAILRGNQVQVPFVRRLEEMCRHFHQLTSLKLTKYSRGHHPLSPTELFTSLSHLHNLLSLTIDTTVMESIPPVTEVLNKNIPTLPSVRILTFKIEKLYNEKRDHEKFSNLNVHHYFPNVETVRFTRWAESECKNCRVECNLKFDRFSKLPVGFFLMFCTLRLTKNLTKCQQLKNVCAKLGESFLEWSVKEINDYKENEIDYFSSEIQQFLNSSENKDKDMFDFELMKNLDSDSVRSEYDDVAGTWYKKVDD